VLAVVIGAVLFIAYVWQPAPQRYNSPYLAQIHARYVDTPVARFQYTKTGQGSPVLLVPGGGQWIYSYRYTIPALAAHHTVYAVDLPGQGYTTLKQSGFDYSLDAMAGALGSFMDAVGLRHAAIVGHSWGGSWSLYFAERHPRRVDRLVLIDSTGLDAPSSSYWRALAYPVLGELAGKLMGETDAAHYLHLAFAHRVPGTTIAEDWAPMSRPANRQALWMSQRDLDYSLTQRLMSGIGAPTFILWGGADRLDPAWQAAAMAHRIPGATYRVLPGCGHNAHEDCPASANPLITGFLDQPAPGR
jgi:pimeloyl-ACP methyl ester carboxylesterase